MGDEFGGYDLQSGVVKYWQDRDQFA